ncbi:MAG: UDP-2,3-diacylglucosamine diphosphatase [Bacteroidia bacterium]|nr:UDP-2,3-diacylglucosamine diphosphatase [Bacteroidia bacterium]
MIKRKLELAVISDLHLGTFGCRAKELLAYLKSIDPEVLVLNGDIIDIWQFSKSYFPKSHMKVVRYIMKLAMNGTKTYYITGNHDEMLRKFSGMNFGNIEVINKLELDLDGKKTLFFHGDVFDFSVQHAKWLAKLGGKCYDYLIHLNTFVNYVSEKFGGKRVSLSKAIKNSVKQAVSFIQNFEEAAIEYAANENCSTVLCGHIHQSADKTIVIKDKTIRYLNSGDWIENLTALEYFNGDWKLYKYVESFVNETADETDEAELASFLKEFKLA